MKQGLIGHLMAHKPHIAFLGTGIMGAPMARHLAEAGFPLKVWNRTPEKAEALAACGATIASSASEAVADADVIVFMVTSGEAADDVLFGTGEVATHLKSGAIVVMMSSIAVDVARAQARRLARYNVGYVDAPVSGGETGAINATLAIMAGGTDHDFEAVLPVLSVLGRVTHIGQVGAGQLTKLANQIIVAGTIALISEAFTLAAQGGADPAQVRQALTGGFADSIILQQQGLRMIEGRFTPGGNAFNQVKDFDAVARVASEVQLSLPTTECVSKLFRAMVAEGDGALDHSGLIRHIQRLNGLLKTDIQPGASS